MIALIATAYLLLSPNPQEKPKEPPPDPLKVEAQRMIQEATSVKEEKSVAAGSEPRKSSVAVKGGRGRDAGKQTPPAGKVSGVGPGGGGAHDSHQTHSTAKQPQKTPAAAPHAAVKVTDHDRRASHLFVANALYQQELANRKQVISVEEVTTPEAALAEMEAGNERFIKGGRVRTLMTAQDPAVRATLTKGQSPFAVVVTCSDSRAVDSLIFDQELGRVFSIRVAGNSPDILGIASIEYAVEHLKSKVVIIMGHTKCGAVGAVADAKGEPMPDNLYIFQHLMAGLLEVAPKDHNETAAEYKDRLQQLNAERQAKAVYERSRIVREFVDHGHLWLLPASYDIETGKVTFLKLLEAAPEVDFQH